MMPQLGILTRIRLRMLMIERVHRGVVSMWVIILSPGSAKSRISSHYSLQKLSTSLPIAIAPNFYGCKNSSMITVFVKSILPSTVTIPVPSTSLRIWFNILELNTQRFDITSLGSFVEDGTLTLEFIHTDDLICLPLTANGLNSFAKTLVSSPLIDLFFSTSFSMHLHLVLCIALFNLFLFVFFLVLVYFVFPIKKMKNQKNTKIVCVCLHWYLCTLDGH